MSWFFVWVGGGGLARNPPPDFIFEPTVRCTCHFCLCLCHVTPGASVCGTPLEFRYHLAEVTLFGEEFVLCFEIAAWMDRAVVELYVLDAVEDAGAMLVLRAPADSITACAASAPPDLFTTWAAPLHATASPIGGAKPPGHWPQTAGCIPALTPFCPVCPCCIC